jgi:hypothetical protein
MLPSACLQAYLPNTADSAVLNEAASPRQLCTQLGGKLRVAELKGRGRGPTLHPAAAGPIRRQSLLSAWDWPRLTLDDLRREVINPAAAAPLSSLASFNPFTPWLPRRSGGKHTNYERSLTQGCRADPAGRPCPPSGATLLGGARVSLTAAARLRGFVCGASNMHQATRRRAVWLTAFARLPSILQQHHSS